jgi:hypothetical protein
MLYILQIYSLIATTAMVYQSIVPSLGIVRDRSLHNAYYSLTSPCPGVGKYIEETVECT